MEPPLPHGHRRARVGVRGDLEVVHETPRAREARGRDRPCRCSRRAAPRRRHGSPAPRRSPSRRGRSGRRPRTARGRSRHGRRARRCCARPRRSLSRSGSDPAAGSRAAPPSRAPRRGRSRDRRRSSMATRTSSAILGVPPVMRSSSAIAASRSSATRSGSRFRRNCTIAIATSGWMPTMTVSAPRRLAVRTIDAQRARDERVDHVERGDVDHDPARAMASRPARRARGAASTTSLSERSDWMEAMR